MEFNRVVVVTGKRAAGWAQAIDGEVCQALQVHGIPAQMIDLDRLTEFCNTPLGKNPATLFLDFNHRIVFPWRRPMISIMVDHPCSLMKELSAANSEDAVTAWVDASHPQAIKALGFSHRAMFLPHAGPAATERMTPFRERDIDIFFAGSLGEPTDRAGWHAANPDVSPGVPDLLFDTIERMEKTGAAVLPALLGVMSDHGIPPSQFTRDTFGGLMSLVLKIGELNRRVNVLTALSDKLRIVIAADYLPTVLRDRNNIRYLGYIDDFDRIRDLMRNSRIVLNTTSKFPAGSHERIWYAMAERTVVLTDSSVFMRQDFRDGENILYLPQKHLAEEDLAPIAAIARDDTRLDRLAESALTPYRDRHSWRKRAPLLIEAMRAA